MGRQGHAGQERGGSTMNVPSHIKARKPQERLERVVVDCLHIITKRKAERVLEAHEAQLKTILNQERQLL